MLDYIIVGFGLAGMSFAEELRKHNKSFSVITDDSQQSSRVAGGLYNPVILKRFTLAWNAGLQMEKASVFYSDLENYLECKINMPMRVLRRFNTVEEQNGWITARDRPGLSPFLSPEFTINSNQSLDVPHQYGEVLHTGKVAITLALECYLKKLRDLGRLKQAQFDHSLLKINSFGLSYGSIAARQIVFCEGYGMLQNPFFKHLPLLGNKGEYVIIESKELKLQEAVKSGIFIIPLGNDIYKVGATYNHQDKSPETTKAARVELEQKLKRVLTVGYTVINQVAGIRPTTKDRKPLLGTHPRYKNVHVLNGFGSRGVLIGPTAAASLFAFIENGTPLEPTMAIDRFA